MEGFNETNETNPYLAAVYRKYRNLKKKLEKIVKIEAKAAKNEKLDADQLALLQSKVVIEKSLADILSVKLQIEEIAAEVATQPKVVIVEQSVSSSADPASLDAALLKLFKVLHVCSRYQQLTGKELPENVDYLGKSLLGLTSITSFADTLAQSVRAAHLVLDAEQGANYEVISKITYNEMNNIVDSLSAELEGNVHSELVKEIIETAQENHETVEVTVEQVQVIEEDDVVNVAEGVEKVVITETTTKTTTVVITAADDEQTQPELKEGEPVAEQQQKPRKQRQNKKNTNTSEESENTPQEKRPKQRGPRKPRTEGEQQQLSTEEVPATEVVKEKKQPKKKYQKPKKEGVDVTTTEVVVDTPVVVIVTPAPVEQTVSATSNAAPSLAPNPNVWAARAASQTVPATENNQQQREKRPVRPRAPRKNDEPNNSEQPKQQRPPRAPKQTNKPVSA